jgi:hypothetical protein
MKVKAKEVRVFPVILYPFAFILSVSLLLCRPDPA